jgi:3D (Asp-Asp-Asp) domain-containing protein
MNHAGGRATGSDNAPRLVFRSLSGIRRVILVPLGVLAIAGAALLASDAAAEDMAGGPPSQWRTVRMRVTAYCPCAKCCGQYADGITANGHRIGNGDRFVAADRQYAFGTEMIIPGYHGDDSVRVLDRGGAIKGDRLDVFFNTHEEALEWGVQYLDVKVRIL